MPVCSAGMFIVEPAEIPIKEYPAYSVDLHVTCMMLCSPVKSNIVG